jgi:thioredoxin-dependent peroxiredoxin
VRDDAQRYAEQGILVLGVNNGDATAHQRFAQRYRLGVPLLVDRDLAVARRYDAVFSLGPFKLVKRTVVGINRQGDIIFYKRGMPSTDEILAAF